MERHPNSVAELAAMTAHAEQYVLRIFKKLQTAPGARLDKSEGRAGPQPSEWSHGGASDEARPLEHCGRRANGAFSLTPNYTHHQGDDSNCCGGL
jgi:hypothetical protein